MIPFDKKQEEPTSKPSYIDIEKDFEVFYRADIGESSESIFQP